MLYFLLTLILIISVLLILVIIVQNPKGGLAANFTSSNQFLGVRQTAELIEKVTWTLGIALIVLSVITSGLYSSQSNRADNEQIRESKIQKQIEESELPVVPNNIPSPAENNQE
ncbi:MAG: preprotein translocase subunit SecG [Vicingaceae bacterium]|nr:MAG: preprotein translocase subunit SecG [Vicingaceae bacterium]